MLQPSLRKIGPACGILAVALFVVLFALAVINYSDYDLFSSYMSCLGVGAGSAMFFNSGAVLAGIVSLPFGISLMRRFNSRISGLGGVFVTLAGLALAGVGLFSEEQLAVHAAFSLTFFVMAVLGMISTGIGTAGRSKVAGAYSILSGLVPFAALASFVPLTEHMAVLAIGAWVVVFSLLGLKAQTEKKL